jgi:ferredoxin-NADP reductase
MRSLRLIFQQLVDWLDTLLDKLTTYKLVLYLLYAYLACAIFLAFSGTVPFKASSIVLSAACLLGVAYVVNTALARFLNIPKNKESDQISALILTLILTPATTLRQFEILAAAALLAMCSKYILVIFKSHIFNPAAFGAVAIGFLFHSYASWWVGTEWMAPAVGLGAILIARKMKRFQLISLFIIISVVVALLTSNFNSASELVKILFLSSPLLFLASVMLTEPLTSPRSRDYLLAYGFVVALLYSLPKLGLTPEEALLIGNVFALIVEPNKRIELIFSKSRKEAASIYSYIFTPASPIHYQAGQYLELTIPTHRSDSRGNRRYLTISSSPTEKDLMFTVKIPDKPSSFKHILHDFKPGQKLLADQLSGSFVLGDTEKQPVAFIDGGIGVTPFRSMVKSMVDAKEKRKVSLLYFAVTPEEFAFKDDFKVAAGLGIETHYCLTSKQAPASWRGLHGNAEPKLISSAIPDYKKRLFYISGPQGFVHAVEKSFLLCCNILIIYCAARK